MVGHIFFSSFYVTVLVRMAACGRKRKTTTEILKEISDMSDDDFDDSDSSGRDSDYRPSTSESPRAFAHHKASDISHLCGQHFLDLLPPPEKRSGPTSRSVVCNKKGIRRESRYFCKTCMSKPALCVAPCFEVYHTDAEI